MGDDNTNQRKRKTKWATSYSNTTQAQAEKRLGFKFQSLRENAISVDDMLANAKYRLEGEAVLKTKEKVYDRIVEYLGVEGYPTEAEQDFKEANINHLVFVIISLILSDFKHITGRGDIKLRCEKEIISTDGETGGTEEFVFVDQISVEGERFCDNCSS